MKKLKKDKLETEHLIMMRVNDRIDSAAWAVKCRLCGKLLTDVFEGLEYHVWPEHVRPAAGWTRENELAAEKEQASDLQYVNR